MDRAIGFIFTGTRLHGPATAGDLFYMKDKNRQMKRTKIRVGRCRLKWKLSRFQEACHRIYPVRRLLPGRMAVHPVELRRSVGSEIGVGRFFLFEFGFYRRIFL